MTTLGAPLALAEDFNFISYREAEDGSICYTLPQDADIPTNMSNEWCAYNLFPNGETRLEVTVTESDSIPKGLKDTVFEASDFNAALSEIQVFIPRDTAVNLKNSGGLFTWPPCSLAKERNT